MQARSPTNPKEKIPHSYFKRGFKSLIHSTGYIIDKIKDNSSLSHFVYTHSLSAPLLKHIPVAKQPVIQKYKKKRGNIRLINYTKKNGKPKNKKEKLSQQLLLPHKKKIPYRSLPEPVSFHTTPCTKLHRRKIILLHTKCKCPVDGKLYS
jgi:hypothetical protein